MSHDRGCCRPHTLEAAVWRSDPWLSALEVATTMRYANQCILHLLFFTYACLLGWMDGTFAAKNICTRFCFYHPILAERVLKFLAPFDMFFYG